MKSDFCGEVLNQSVFKTSERKIIYNTSKRWSISLWKFHLQTVSKWVSWDNDSWKVEWPCCLCSIREALLTHLQLQRLQVHPRLNSISWQLIVKWRVRILEVSMTDENPERWCIWSAKTFAPDRSDLLNMECKWENKCSPTIWKKNKTKS